MQAKGITKTIDPILWQDIDDNNEWLIGRLGDEDSQDVVDAQYDLVFFNDNLTWCDIARVGGVEEPRFNTRARASSSMVPPSRGIASSSRSMPLFP